MGGEALSEKRTGDSTGRALRKDQRPWVSYALFVRAIPFMPFQVGNLLFGVSSVTLWDYITTTLITVTIGQGITVFLVSMASDFMAQKAGTVFGLLLKGLYYFGIYYIMKKNTRAEEKEELPL